MVNVLLILNREPMQRCALIYFWCSPLHSTAPEGRGSVASRFERDKVMSLAG